MGGQIFTARSFLLTKTMEKFLVIDGRCYQVFIKYTNAANTHTWSISDVPLPGYELHPAHIVDGNVVQYRYIGAYDACVANTVSGLYESGLNWSNNITAGQRWNVSAYKLSSVSGIYPAEGITRSHARQLAANRGTRWRQLDYYLLSLIQLLYLTEYGNFNSQSSIGNGNVEVTGGYPTASGNQSDSPHSIAGKSNSIGNASGGTNSTTRDTAWVSYRGIENLWGNVRTYIDGVNFRDEFVYVCENNIRSNYNDNTSTNYILIGSKIQSIGYPIKISYKNSFIPTQIGGSTSTYICDRYIQSFSWRPYLYGGAATDGLDAGIFFIASNLISATQTQSTGARLTY